MTIESRRRFLKSSLGLAAVATAGPVQLIAWLRPSSLIANGNGTMSATYQIKVSDFPTFEIVSGESILKIGLTEVGSSIKLTEFDELEMNPDHCERSGIDGNDYPISVVRVKESGEDAFTAVSSWCPHNNESQLNSFEYQLGENGLFVCREHEFSTFRADGTWVPPEDSPFKDAPPADDFYFNVGPDGKPFLTRFTAVFDGDDTITLSGILVACQLPTSVQDEAAAAGYELHQNMPNPFRGKTLIPITLPSSGEISLTLLALTGELIETIAEGRFDAGDHLVPFNSKEIPAGTYFYRLDVDGKSLVRRMIIVR